MANLFERRVTLSEIEKLASKAQAARQAHNYAAVAAAWRGCEVRYLTLGKKLLATNCESLATAFAAQEQG